MQSYHHIVIVFESIILLYLGGNALYLLFFAIAGFLHSESRQNPFNKFRHITIVITAYKEDRIMDTVIQSALQQDYPGEMIEIILIADTFAEESLQRLRNYPIKLVEARFSQSTKVESLKLSLSYLNPKTDIVIILDADNLMELSFLRKLNLALDSGFRVVQCHRSAKNTNTPFALLDAISEEVNNNIFRAGHVAVGLSASLIGSAMAFRTDVYQKYIPLLNAVGGFDKELELKLLRDRIFIEYLGNAFVLDEKVQSSQVFYKQRKRWMSSQIVYLGRDFLPSVLALILHGNINYFPVLLFLKSCSYLTS